MPIAVVASLIAAIITPDGILVAADTAMRDNAGFHVVRKVVPCGRGRVVAATGKYAWSYRRAPDEFIDVDVFRVISTVCSGTEAKSVQLLAQELASAVGTVAADLFPAAALDANGYVLTLMVAGYDADVPTVVTISISVLQPGRYRLGFWKDNHRCVSIDGFSALANALLEGSASIPRALTNRPEVAMVRAALGSSHVCPAISVEQAEQFFRLAVSVSLEFPQGFERGDVNWPIDFTLVRPTGSEPIRREQERQP